MKKLFLISIALFTMSLLFTSCAKEETPPTNTEDGIATLRALPNVSNTLFTAGMRWIVTNCDFGWGSCGWGDPDRRCDIPWRGTLDEGLNFIEEMDDADAIMQLETYEDQEILGVRFLGVSETFSERSQANGSNGDTFQVVESVELNQEATEILGFRNIQIHEGEYEMFIDQDTGNRMVYINASFQ